MKIKFVILSLIILSIENSNAQNPFDKGTHELGITSLGIGYSSVAGLLIEAGTRYQYYVLDRFALGGNAFYSKLRDREWMGIGPTASCILFTLPRWFSRLNQQLTLAKINGTDRDPSTFYGITSLGLNYVPESSNYFIGAAFAHSYALDGGNVIRPNQLVINLGWFWN